MNNHRDESNTDEKFRTFFFSKQTLFFFFICSNNEKSISIAKQKNLHKSKKHNFISFLVCVCVVLLSPSRIHHPIANRSRQILFKSVERLRQHPFDFDVIYFRIKQTKKKSITAFLVENSMQSSVFKTM